MRKWLPHADETEMNRKEPMSSKQTCWTIVGSILALMLAGCGACSQAGNSLLAAPMAQAEQAATAASSSLMPGSTPPLAVTLTYSEYLTLTAGDVWSAPTPIHTPIIPTERPFLPKPTWPTMTPNPTPTFLPDRGVRMGKAEELTVTLDASLQSAILPRIISLSTDGKTLVGAIETGDDTYAVAVISLISGKVQMLPVGQDRPREPRVFAKYVVWTTPRQLHFYDLENDQFEQLDSGIVRHARISDDIMVWDKRGTIIGYDLSAKESFPVAARPDMMEYAPEISGEWVIYVAWDEHPSESELWKTNIRTQENICIGKFPLRRSEEPYLGHLYAVDVPWVVWSTEAALHLYNLVTRSTYTVSVEACPSSMSRPTHLALSKNVLIFTCGQDLGYDIEEDVFFSLPTYIPEMEGSGWVDWAISGDRLVWARNFGAWGEEESHIYTARIERDP